MCVRLCSHIVSRQYFLGHGVFYLQRSFAFRHNSLFRNISYLGPPAECFVSGFVSGFAEVNIVSGPHCQTPAPASASRVPIFGRFSENCEVSFLRGNFLCRNLPQHTSREQAAASVKCQAQDVAAKVQGPASWPQGMCKFLRVMLEAACM